jgi:hypothetical protein
MLSMSRDGERMRNKTSWSKVQERTARRKTRMHKQNEKLERLKARSLLWS